MNAPPHDEADGCVKPAPGRSTEGESLMPRYGEASQDSVERAMRKRKHGTLRSGRSGRRVTSQKQAVAIGLSEAREKGAKVPDKNGSRSSSTRGRRSGSSSSKRRSSSTR